MTTPFWCESSYSLETKDAKIAGILRVHFPIGEVVFGAEVGFGAFPQDDNVADPESVDRGGGGGG